MSEAPRPSEAAEGELGHLQDAAGAEFSAALRAAVATRGVSLESLKNELARRGCRVSIATLSYWRSGHRSPDRGGSMLALAEMEDLLSLPAGFLTSKVNPRGPGSAVASGLPTHYQTVARREPSSEARDSDSGIVELGLDWDDGLDRVSYHDRIEIREDRTDGAHDVRTVFVARRAGVDRFPVWWSHDDPKAFPFVVALTNCHLGRALEVREECAVAAEMLLDRTLDAGESFIVEHRLEAIGQNTPTLNFHRQLSAPIRELVIEVRFHPDATPRAAATRRTVGGCDTLVPTPVVGNSLHLLEIDPLPGIYGLEWEW